MIDPFVCEYCKEELEVTEDPDYSMEWDLIQPAFCTNCNKLFYFRFTLSDIEEDEDYEDE